MNYEKTLLNSKFACGKILSTYVVLYNIGEDTKSFTVQKNDQKLKINRSSFTLKTLKDKKPVAITPATPGFQDGILVCTLGIQTPYKDNSFIDAVLTKSAVEYIAKVGGKKVVERLAEDGFMVRVKPVALDWTACTNSAIEDMLPLEYMSEKQQESIISILDTNAGKKKDAEQKQITSKKNLGLVVAAAALLLNK